MYGVPDFYQNDNVKKGTGMQWRHQVVSDLPTYISQERRDAHYDILSDIMLIVDHGNICLDTIFMIIIMHSFPDIEENLFFDNGGPHLHTHNMHMILQHFE